MTPHLKYYQSSVVKPKSMSGCDVLAHSLCFAFIINIQSATCRTIRILWQPDDISKSSRRPLQGMLPNMLSAPSSKAKLDAKLCAINSRNSLQTGRASLRCLMHAAASLKEKKLACSMQLQRPLAREIAT